MKLNTSSILPVTLATIVFGLTSCGIDMPKAVIALYIALGFATK